MARFCAKKLRNVMRMKAIGEGYMQQSETGGYVRLEDYNKAVDKAAEEQRAAAEASRLVKKLFQSIEYLGSTRLEMMARQILGKAGAE